jgi:hypothetical protein
MSWNYSSEASYGASRTRTAAPSAKVLRGAVRYRGFFLFPKRSKCDIWDPATGRWDWQYSERVARQVIDAKENGR